MSSNARVIGFFSVFLLVFPMAFAITPNGTTNFTLYPNNPVGPQFYPYEDSITAKAEWNFLPGSTPQLMDAWYHTNSTGNNIAYWYGSNPYNLSDGVGILTNLQNGFSSPAVTIFNGAYWMYVTKTNNNGVYAYTSTDKVTWSPACGGALLIPGLNANLATQNIDGTLYLLIQQNAGTWNIVGYNSTDGCTINSIGTLLVNEYNPWFGRFGNEWIVTVSTPNASNYNLRSYRGTSLLSLSYDETLIQLPTGQAWDLGHLGDGYMYIVPSNASAYFDRDLYYFYGGNNTIGVATDADDRTFYEIFDVQPPTTPPTPETPPSSSDAQALNSVIGVLAITLLVGLLYGFVPVEYRADVLKWMFPLLAIVVVIILIALL